MSGTWETRIAQPQIGSVPERMYKHTVEFLGEVWLSHEWIVCLSAAETMRGAAHERDICRDSKDSELIVDEKKSYLLLREPKTPSGLTARCAAQLLAT